MGWFARATRYFIAGSRRMMWIFKADHACSPNTCLGPSVARNQSVDMLGNVIAP